MSPRTADASVRDALVEAAARLVATQGPAALTLRAVAEAVGTSTMAVYTHFGGMTELRRAVRIEGFARLRAELDGIRRTGDSVADMAMLGAAYYINATKNPDLYRAMFMEQPLDEQDAAVGIDAFGLMIDAVQRTLDEQRLASAEPIGLATQFWAFTHGVVTLRLAQLLDDAQAIDCLTDLSVRLLVSHGDDPAAAKRSIAKAIRKIRAARAQPTGEESGMTVPSQAARQRRR